MKNTLIHKLHIIFFIFSVLPICLWAKTYKDICISAIKNSSEINDYFDNAKIIKSKLDSFNNHLVFSSSFQTQTSQNYQDLSSNKTYFSNNSFVLGAEFPKVFGFTPEIHTNLDQLHQTIYSSTENNPVAAIGVQVGFKTSFDNLFGSKDHIQKKLLKMQFDKSYILARLHVNILLLQLYEQLLDVIRLKKESDVLDKTVKKAEYIKSIFKNREQFGRNSIENKVNVDSIYLALIGDYYNKKRQLIKARTAFCVKSCFMNERDLPIEVEELEQWKQEFTSTWKNRKKVSVSMNYIGSALELKDTMFEKEILDLNLKNLKKSNIDLEAEYNIGSANTGLSINNLSNSSAYQDVKVSLLYNVYKNDANYYEKYHLIKNQERKIKETRKKHQMQIENVNELIILELNILNDAKNELEDSRNNYEETENLFKLGRCKAEMVLISAQNLKDAEKQYCDAEYNLSFVDAELMFLSDSLVDDAINKVIKKYCAKE